MKNKQLNRKLELIKYLSNKNYYISTEEIGKNIRCSNKTVQKELIDLMPILEKFSSRLIKKPGKGVILELDPFSEKELFLYLKKNLEVNDNKSSSKERQRYILSKIFFSDIKSLKEVSQYLDISKLSINKDFLDIETWLFRFSIFLKRNERREFFLEGKEEDIRAAIVYYLFKIDKELNESKLNNTDFYIHQKLSENLENILTIEEFCTLEKIILDYFKNIEISLSDESFISLIFTISVSIFRIKKNKFIETKFLDNGCQTNFLSLKNVLEVNFNIKFNNEELNYLYNLIDYHISNSSHNYSATSNPIEKRIEEISVQIYEYLIRLNPYISSEAIVEISSYLFQLLKGKRLNISILNYHIDEIKYNYSTLYGVLWLFQEKIKDIHGKLLSEDDIGYFTLFLDGIISKYSTKLKLKIALVSNKEIGMFSSLLFKLKNILGENVILDTYKVIENDNLFSNYDLILSTRKLKYGIKHIHISPVLNNNDLTKIRFELEKLKKYI
ncbi:MAG: hypothetical protein RR191_06460 [Cetobacterium sp.]|uniref:BglG family transcription antiterminator n=1 Tax=Cetobacterium sp. TaxID=2071632 RepID=UPI002FCAC9C1